MAAIAASIPTTSHPAFPAIPMKAHGAEADATTGAMTTPLMGERFLANRDLRERLRRVAVWQEKRLRTEQNRAAAIFELAWRADLNDGRITRNGRIWTSSDLRRIAETISACARAMESHANSTWAKYNAVTARHGVRFMRGWPAAVLAKAAAERELAQARVTPADEEARI